MNTPPPSIPADRRHRYERAFTILEVGIVIAIIVVLALLTLPVVSGLRAKSQTVACTQKMKQVGLAALVRAGENNGMLLWKNMVWEPRTDEQTWKTVLLRERYILDQKAFYCPSLPVPDELIIAPYLGYGLRSVDELRTTHPELIFGTWGPVENGRTGGTRLISLRAIAQSSRFPLWTDTLFTASNAKYGGFQASSYSLNTAGTRSGVHLRHQGKTNVMFADGHLETLGAAQLKEIGFISGYDQQKRPVTF